MPDGEKDKKTAEPSKPQADAEPLQKELRPELMAVESQPEDLPDETVTHALATTEAALQEDEPFGLAQLQPPTKPRFWRRTSFWLTVIFLLLVAAAAAWLIRPSRIYIVNLLGLHTNVTVLTRTKVAAGQQSAVIKNVALHINGEKHVTNNQGVATVSVPYGDVSIQTEKPGFEVVTHRILLDFDPFFYQLGGKQDDENARKIILDLQNVGITFMFKAKDWLSDGPVLSGEFSIGDVVAKPDDQGVVQFNLPTAETATLKVAAKFGGSYIDREFELPVESLAQQEEVFVPAGKHYFVSKRSGTLGVYSSNLDGSDTTEFIAGTSTETAALNFVVSPSGKYAAMASTRDGKKDAKGNLVVKLSTVDLATKKLTTVDEAESFQFIDWTGDTLVYKRPVATDAGVVEKMAALDAAAAKKTELASAYRFGQARVASGNVIYTVLFKDGTDGAEGSPELRVVSAKGGSEKTLGYKVSVVTQTDYDTVVYQGEDTRWHEYNLASSQAKDGSPPSSTQRIYVAQTSPDGQYRLYLDKIDGKNTLLTKSVASGADAKLHSADGLRGPFRWVGGNIVLRIVDITQSADYVVTKNGKKMKKITDISASSATSQGVQ